MSSVPREQIRALASVFSVSLSLAAPSREGSRRWCGSPDCMRMAFSGRVWSGGFGWQQAEQGGDGTRQTEDWTAVATEERVMMWFVGPCPAGGWATGPAVMLYGKWRSMAALPIRGPMLRRCCERWRMFGQDFCGGDRRWVGRWRARPFGGQRFRTIGRKMEEEA